MDAPGSSAAIPLPLQGSDSDARLQQLGISPQRLADALDRGESAAREADVFHPVTAAGTARWMETVHTLRAGLVLDGWSTNDERNAPRIIDPNGRVAILPVHGNAATGVADQTPKTARARGPVTSRAVQITGQLELALDLRTLISQPTGENRGELATWFLLYHRSANDGLRAELSLPIEVNDQNVVVGWKERILLPPRTYDAYQVIPRDAGGDDDSFDFPVAAH